MNMNKVKINPTDIEFLSFNSVFYVTYFSYFCKNVIDTY